MHALLIEDDLDVGTALTKALRSEGIDVEWLRSAADARHFVGLRVPDAIVLDLGLPDGHGLALLRQWRDDGLEIPIIVVTASTDLDDRLSGLYDGADDFLVKPFAVSELIARMHAVCRRAAKQSSSVWRFKSLELDTQRHQCRVSGAVVELAPREFELLCILARQAGEVLPKHRLAQLLEPLGEPVDINAVEVHVHKLRRKLGAELIQTVRGVGYMLCESPVSPA
jgi:two-component system, OmpR family, response regulator QseB